MADPLDQKAAIGAPESATTGDEKVTAKPENSYVEPSTNPTPQGASTESQDDGPSASAMAPLADDPPAEPPPSATDAASESKGGVIQGKEVTAATTATTIAAEAGNEEKLAPKQPSPEEAAPSATTTTPAAARIPVVERAPVPKVEEPPLIVVVDSDNAAEAPVATAPPVETTTGVSLPGAPAAVVRTSSGDATVRSIDQATAVTVATAPAALQNHQSSSSDDFDDEIGTDGFIKSPNGQNPIVERSPGGRYVRFMEKLGSGASKDVFRAYDTQEGIEVAWNVVSLAGVPKTERNRIVNEVRLLERLHHHNIISFHGSWVNRERQEVHFVTEILSSGTLKSFINKVQVIRWKIAKRWAVQILKGLDYLHSQDPPVIHRDLKCENIFINGTSGDLRIGDLGLSTVHRNGRVLSVLGTPEFMAPDMYEESSYDEKVDIYAFGMCMLEIFTKEIPYKECRNPAQIYKKVSSGELPENLHRIQSQMAREFVMLCLGYKDENGVYVRPTTKELLAHEFLVKRPNDEDEVLVDAPLIKRTIAENPESVSPANSGWAAPAQSRSQSFPSEGSGDKGRAAALKKRESDLGSADGDESDRFEEMPDSEVNIRKVKVLMGRGQELEEDEQPMADSSAQSVEGSVHSRVSHVDKQPETDAQGPTNGVNLRPKREKKVSITGSTIQVTQPGHYLVAAAVIDHEAAQSYPDDILKLVVTLPVEGQTQNVQFDFHLVEDDAIQVGKEMVAELGIPQGAVLEISETISGLACAARMERDKHKMRQQNAQGQMAPQSQQQGGASQQQPRSGSQDIPQQQQLHQDQPPPQQQQQQPQGVPMQPPPQQDYKNNQARPPPHTQQVLQQPPEQVQRQQSQQPPQQQLPPSNGQASQIPLDMQSQPSSYSQPMHNQNPPTQHSQMHGQVPQGHQLISDSQSQPSHFVYEPQQNSQQQTHMVQGQAMGQHNSSMPSDTQSLPAYGYDGARNQPPVQNTSYGFDPGQQQNQEQPQQMQPQHMAPLQPQHMSNPSNQGPSYHYEPQITQQGQSNPQMGQQGVIHVQQQNQMHQQNQLAPQQPMQTQQQQPMQNMHQNNQHHGGNPLPPNAQQQQQPHQNMGGQIGMQPYGQVSVQSSQHQQTPGQAPHGNMMQQQQQQQQQNRQQQQHMTYPHSPNHPQRNNIGSAYEHGVSLPNAHSQMMGASAETLKRSTSVNSNQASLASTRPAPPPFSAATVPGRRGESPSSERKFPPSRTNSGHAVTPVKGNLSGLSQQLADDVSLSSQQNDAPPLSSTSIESSLLLGDNLEFSALSNDDGYSNDELRKLDEDFQKNLLRAKRVFDNRMDNLQRSQVEREAQHKKTLEKHEKEQAEFEKRLESEAKEQSRRIEQLQRDWDRKRVVLAQQKRASDDTSGNVSANASLSSSPDTGYSMPAASSASDQMATDDQPLLNPTLSLDSSSERGLS